MYPGILIAILLAGPFAWGQTKTISCKKVKRFECRGGQAKYPDLVRCGDFVGFVRLSSALASRGEFELPADGEMFSGPECSGDEQVEPLGRCYYDSSSHGGLSAGGVEGKFNPFSLGMSMAQTQSFNVHYIAANSPEVGCSKKLEPSMLKVCASFVSCRGAEALFKICRASAEGACPPADQCASDMPEQELMLRADDRLSASPSFRKGQVSHHVVLERNVGPLVIATKESSSSICVVPYRTEDQKLGSTTFGVAAALADEMGCPSSLATVWQDKCVNPRFSKIQSYKGSAVYPAYSPAGKALEAK